MLLLFLGGIISGTITHEHHHAHGVHQIEQSADVSATAQTGSFHGDEQAEHHNSWNWFRITFLILSLVALAIVATVPDHFLNEHLWHHLIRVHAWKIFLWTVGALAVTHLLVESFDIDTIVNNHKLPLLLTACMVGILPTSGPHMIFITLYAQGAIPLSVLVANCIVQDGHGLIPTLAHSRKTFVFIKSLKFVLGFGAGLILHAMGW
jgi:hypothetical protein